MQKNVNSGPQAIHMANRDDNNVLTVVRRLCGQPAGTPSGVEAQSTAARSAPTSTVVAKIAVAAADSGA
ncbi:MAG: hypothetical protein U0R66_13050 [Mycobacterium sp.]